MKTSNSFFLATGVSLLLFLNVCSPKPAMNDSLQSVLNRAREERKRVLLDFYADWCGACKKLDEVMTDGKIKALLKEAFVVLKIDGDTEYGKQLMKHYIVAGMPSLIVVDPNGEKAEKIASGGRFDIYKPSDLLQRLLLASKGQNELDYLLEQWNLAPQDKPRSKLAYEIGMEYIGRHSEKGALEWMRRAIQLDPDNKAGDAAQALYSLGDELYGRIFEDFDRTKRYFQAIRRKFPESITATHAAKSEAKMLWKKGDKAGAKIVFLDFIKAAPQNMSARHRFAEFCLDYNYGLDEAVKTVEEGLALSPNAGVGLWEDLALLYARQKDCKKSLSAIQQAIKESPHSEYTKGVYKEIIECTKT